MPCPVSCLIQMRQLGLWAGLAIALQGCAVVAVADAVIPDGDDDDGG